MNCVERFNVLRSPSFLFQPLPFPFDFFVSNCPWQFKEERYFFKVLLFCCLLSKNGCTDVCLSVSLSVSLWRGNGNPQSCTNLDEILHAHFHLSKKGFGEVLIPTTPSPPRPRGDLEPIYKTKDVQQGERTVWGKFESLP